MSPEPALLQVMGPSEVIVVIATEVQIGETSGMMNIGIPSSVVKLAPPEVRSAVVGAKSNVPDESARILGLINDQNSPWMRNSRARA